MAQQRVCCECSQIYEVSCGWSGPATKTLRVEVMPPQFRASHEAANTGGYTGAYPLNGAIRIRVEESCAERLIEFEDGWARLLR